MRKPIIGISAPVVFDERMFSQRVTYPAAVAAAGGRPILLPCMSTTEDVRAIVDMVDGLIMPGGADVEPSLYGYERIPECGKSVLTDDNYDIALVKEATRQGKPILGICRGMQISNVRFGGTMWQDIPSQIGKEINHSMFDADGKQNFHEVKIKEGTNLSKIFGTTVETNTSHHQAVKDVAPGLILVGTAPDGVVEAIEKEDGSFLGVQWHPELMQDREVFRELFKVFVDKCRK